MRLKRNNEWMGEAESKLSASSASLDQDIGVDEPQLAKTAARPKHGQIDATRLKFPPVGVVIGVSPTARRRDEARALVGEAAPCQGEEQLVVARGAQVHHLRISDLQLHVHVLLVTRDMQDDGSRFESKPARHVALERVDGPRVAPRAVRLESDAHRDGSALATTLTSTRDCRPGGENNGCLRCDER
jgi:hypothetical protein